MWDTSSVFRPLRRCNHACGVNVIAMAKQRWRIRIRVDSVDPDPPSHVHHVALQAKVTAAPHVPIHTLFQHGQANPRRAFLAVPPGGGSPAVLLSMRCAAAM